jgi:hypothetical protein
MPAIEIHIRRRHDADCAAITRSSDMSESEVVTFLRLADVSRRADEHTNRRIAEVIGLALPLLRRQRSDLIGPTYMSGPKEDFSDGFPAPEWRRSRSGFAVLWAGVTKRVLPLHRSATGDSALPMRP